MTGSWGLNKRAAQQILEIFEKSQVEIRLMIAKDYDGQYLVHCIQLGEGIQKSDLEGRLLRGQWTIRAKSMQKFSETYESELEELRVAYHRDPPESFQITPEYTHIMYKWVNRSNDAEGKSTLQEIINLHDYFFKNQKRMQD